MYTNTNRLEADGSVNRSLYSYVLWHRPVYYPSLDVQKYTSYTYISHASSFNGTNAERCIM